MSRQRGSRTATKATNMMAGRPNWDHELARSHIRYVRIGGGAWSGALDEGVDVGRCLGIRCNIWDRAMRRREITHKLRGGGNNNIGWGALMWQDMVGTGEVRFGSLEILRYLPKKIANFLHEYCASSGWFQSLNLPNLPSDRSRIDVHAMLEPIHIARLLRRLQVNLSN